MSNSVKINNIEVDTFDPNKTSKTIQMNSSTSLVNQPNLLSYQSTIRLGDGNTECSSSSSGGDCVTYGNDDVVFKKVDDPSWSPSGGGGTYTITVNTSNLIDYMPTGTETTCTCAQEDCSRGSAILLLVQNGIEEEIVVAGNDLINPKYNKDTKLWHPSDFSKDKTTLQFKTSVYPLKVSLIANDSLIFEGFNDDNGTKDDDLDGVYVTAGCMWNLGTYFRINKTNPGTKDKPNTDMRINVTNSYATGDNGFIQVYVRKEPYGAKDELLMVSSTYTFNPASSGDTWTEGINNDYVKTTAWYSGLNASKSTNFGGWVYNGLIKPAKILTWVIWDYDPTSSSSIASTIPHPTTIIKSNGNDHSCSIIFTNSVGGTPNNIHSNKSNKMAWVEPGALVTVAKMSATTIYQPTDTPGKNSGIAQILKTDATTTITADLTAGSGTTYCFCINTLFVKFKFWGETTSSWELLYKKVWSDYTESAKTWASPYWITNGNRYQVWHDSNSQTFHLDERYTDSSKKMQIYQYFWTKTGDVNNYLIPFTHYIDPTNKLVRTPLKWYGAKDVAKIDSTLKPHL